MAKKLANSTHIEGYLYEHKLEKRVTGPDSKNPGTEYISGTISIATDDDMLNIVQVRYSYVTELTAKKTPNNTWTILSGIIDGKLGNVMEHGKENACKVRADSAVGLNEWYSDRDNTGNPTLVSIRVNDGGFIHTTNELGDPKTRATFETDMVITNVIHFDADPERDLPERATLKGCVFNFRGDLLPVEYTVLGDKAIAYFESLDASPKSPVFTKVQGQQVSKTVVRTTTEESAFGDAIVKETRSSQKDFVVTWALPEPYAWDSEDTLLASELSEKMSAREIHLAEIKKNQEERQANRGNAIGGTTAAAPSGKVYNF